MVDGLPDIRMVPEGRAATGRGWMGLTRREAYNVLDIRLVGAGTGLADAASGGGPVGSGLADRRALMGRFGAGDASDT